MIYNIIKQWADEQLQEISRNGFISAGHNGPYYDPETPVRNSAHWIIIFSYLYKKSGQEQYLYAIKTLSEYLYNERENKQVFAYNCREKSGKDHVNGTIGQAWAIEGLVEAAKILKEEKYYDLAKKVFFQHKFSYKYGVWNRIEIDGKILGYDNTYNHQLWLAAAGAEIISYKDDDEIKSQIIRFLDVSEKTNLFSVDKNGIIKHFAYIPDTYKHFFEYHKRNVNLYISEKQKKPTMKYKEEGYHYFNMYGLAILYSVFTNHSFFKCKKFKKALEYTLDLNNLNMLDSRNAEDDVTGLALKYKSDCNIYSYGYNSPAFELPYIAMQFSTNIYEDSLVEKMWNLQIEKTNIQNQIKNVEDIVTLKARVYELVRALSNK